MTNAHACNAASGGVRAFDPRLLGFGLFLAWCTCMPWVKGHVLVYTGPSYTVVVHAVLLIALAVLANRRRRILYTRPLLIAGGATATLAPVSLYAGNTLLGGGDAITTAGTLGQCFGMATLYVLWNEQYARHPQRVAWVAYAASFAIDPLSFFVVSALPLPVATVLVCAMPPISCVLLHRCAQAPLSTGEPVQCSWRFPWRPALLMVAFSFAYYMLLHLSGGVSNMGRLGGLVISGIVLVGCARFFDRFDARWLYKTCPPLMICSLLLYTQGVPFSTATAPLAEAGFTGFTLFMACILNSICFRYGAPAGWLFGIVQGGSVLAHAMGSSVGFELLGAGALDAAALRVALDGTAMVLVFLSLLFLSERDFSTTWGIEPASSPSRDASRSDPETRAGSYEDFAWRCAHVARHFGLTHREEEVLALVAQGKNAAEIEAALYISHNTAKGHLRHVYAKLGVHTREEAAAAVHAWGQPVPRS